MMSQIQIHILRAAGAELLEREREREVTSREAALGPIHSEPDNNH